MRLEKRRKAGDASISWKVQIPFGAFNTARDDPLRWGIFGFEVFCSRNSRRVESMVLVVCRLYRVLWRFLRRNLVAGVC